MGHISCKKGYKYQLTADYTVNIPIKPNTDLTSPSGYIQLSAEGDLTIKKGYAWDGPSGPTIDTNNFMRAALVHDALYQLMRENNLDCQGHRKPADRLMQKMCKEDGMWAIRSWWVYMGVRVGGDPAADPCNKKSILKFP